jgi:protein O-GlcNAc transferase
MGVADEPEPGPLPALAAGHVTFGCLNNFCKVTEDQLSLWGQILGRMPRSRLKLLVPRGTARERVLAIMARQNIAPERIEFVQMQKREAYFQSYRAIDLGLDTLPYNGHTTSLDAMWMGVPVVSLVGKTVVGRAGLSQLTNLGLTELVADSPARFIDIVAGLAGDLPRLAQLRQTLRRRMLDSLLTDASRFARGVEAAYRQMWVDWCEAR